MCRGSLGGESWSISSRPQRSTSGLASNSAVRGGRLARTASTECVTVRPSSEHRLRIVACPEPGCDAVAEIVDRHTLHSTDGPVSMVRTRCIGKHIRDWMDVAA